jgi:type II secretory pathway component PulK
MTARHKLHFKKDRGSALLISLWALLLLAGVVFALAKFIDQDITRLLETNNGLDAKAYAHSGLAIALHPLVTPQTPLLEKEFATGRGYRVRLSGEGGKLNIVWLLTGEDPSHLEILRSYLMRRGLSFEEQQVFVDSLLDWVDADKDKHLNGMEESPDYLPPNRMFLSLDEIEQVNGSGPLVKQGGWEDDFTLYSQGPVDLAAAPLMVLAVLPGIGDARAQTFIRLRDGVDKLNGTVDDFPFKKGMPEAMSYLGLGQKQQQQLASLVAFRDPTYFIESNGFAGNVDRQVTVVARKGTAQPTILLWKEL